MFVDMLCWSAYVLFINNATELNMALTQHEIDKYAAECVLVLWAQDGITTAQAKATIVNLNYDIDFRQPDNGATMSACYIPTGEYEELTV